jgi:hypothetical protein
MQLLRNPAPREETPLASTATNGTSIPLSILILAVSTLWSLTVPGSKTSLDLRNCVEWLSEQDKALFSYYFVATAICTAQDSDLAELELEKWFNVFPSGRRWVPMLLVGTVAFIKADTFNVKEESAKKRIGYLLWQWRNEPIDEKWLRESDTCRAFDKEDHLDLLKHARQSIENEVPATLGLSTEQHEDFLVWCDRMISQRAELKSNDKEE